MTVRSKIHHIALWAGGILIFTLLFTPRVRADNDPGAVALLKKVTDVYKNASSFSTNGHYEVDLQTAQPVKLMGTFKILYTRPDEIRVDWTDTQMGGQVITSSVFTQDKTLYFLFGVVNKVSPQSTMELALGTAAGVSHGISYAIPNLLRGKPGYFNFDSLLPLTHAAVNGKDFLILKGTTKFQGDVELTIDPATDLIFRIGQHQLIKSGDLQRQMAKMRAQLAKTNPTLAAKLKDFPVRPDFTAINVTTFDDPVFGKTLTPADFVYPVPSSVVKADNVLK